jgi:hypothetical protein
MANGNGVHAKSTTIAAHDDQWIYRPTTNNNQHDLAIFLSWDYSAVLFRVWCEHPRGLVIQYFGDGVAPFKGHSIALVANGYHPMSTTDTRYGGNSILQARIPLTQSLIAEIESASEIDIDAPNESEEPWYTGTASPLKRVIQKCR